MSRASAHSDRGHARLFLGSLGMGRPITSPWSFVWDVRLSFYLVAGRLEHDGVVVLQQRPDRAFLVFEGTSVMTTNLRHLLRVAASFEGEPIDHLQQKGLAHCIVDGPEGGKQVRVRYEDIAAFTVDASDLADVTMTSAGKRLLEGGGSAMSLEQAAP